MPILRYLTSGLLNVSHTHLVRNYFSEIFCPKKKKIWILQSPSSTLECCYMQFLTKRKKYIKIRRMFVLAFTFDWTLNFRRKKEIDQRQTTVVCPSLFKDDWRRLRSTGDERDKKQSGARVVPGAQIYKHTNIQMHKHKYANTNTQVHIHKYK